jgi:hypothetical protein
MMKREGDTIKMDKRIKDALSMCSIIVRLIKWKEKKNNLLTA